MPMSEGEDKFLTSEEMRVMEQDRLSASRHKDTRLFDAQIEARMQEAKTSTSSSIATSTNVPPRAQTP